MEKKNTGKKNLTLFITIGLSLLCVGFLFNHFFLKEKKATTKDFLTANKLFEKKDALSLEMLETGLALLKKHPELEAQYQGALSLAFAQSENFEDSFALLKDHLKRIENLCPSEYLDFANTSILISEEKLDEAFTNALLLEEKLKEAPSYSRLRLLNLIRIAFLAQEKKEVLVRNETLLKIQKDPLYPSIEPLFCEENFNLTTYLIN